MPAQNSPNSASRRWSARRCDDGDLALCVWSRPDIPRQNLVKLFVDASEAVKNQLIEADPRRADLIKSMVAQATDEIQTKARAGSNEFAEAAARWCAS